MNITDIPNNGLIFSWLMDPVDGGQEIRNLSDLVLEPEQELWIHLNFANAQVQNWLEKNEQLPEDIIEIIREDVSRARQKNFTQFESTQLIFFNDFVKVFKGEELDEMATLWIIAVNNVLVTFRLHPIQSTDELRARLQKGQLQPSSIADIYTYLLDLREEVLHDHANQLLNKMDRLEEIIIRGGTLPEHETLGRIRIQCNRMRRYFSPELSAIRHLSRVSPAWLGEENRVEVVELSEKLTVFVEELNHLYERAKVLQDEQTAHIAEFNAKNLHVLSVLTAIFLPMTLITGIMGMNMEDLPGLKGSFSEVTILMLGAGLLMYLILRFRKII